MKNLFTAILFIFVIQAGMSQNTSAYEKFNESFFNGLTELIKENPSKAIEDFEKCLRKKDSSAAVYYYLAVAYHKLQKPDKAKYYLQQAIRLNPENKWFGKLQNKINQSPIVKFEVKEETKSEIKNESEALQLLKSHADDYQKVREIARKYAFYPTLQYEAAQIAFRYGKYSDAETFLKNGMDFARFKPALLKKYYALFIDIYTQTGKNKEAGKYKSLLKDMK